MAGILSGRSGRGGSSPRPRSTLTPPERCSDVFLIYDIMEIVVFVGSHAANLLESRMSYPSLSTDQVAAFVELAREGSLRKAAQVLMISEQGLRNRLVALEERLK